MSNFTFPVTLANVTTSHVKAVTALEKSAVKMLDVYRAEKIPATHLISPRSKDSTCPSQEWYDGLREAVVAGFNVDEKRILKAPRHRWTTRPRNTRPRCKARSVARSRILRTASYAIQTAKRQRNLKQVWTRQARISKRILARSRNTKTCHSM